MIIKKPLVNFILWCLTFVFICLIGVSNVFALTNENQITFYNNNGSSVDALSTDYDSTSKESSALITTITNSYGGLVVYQLSTPLVKNHLYKVFLNVGAEGLGGFTTLSSKNKLGVGNTPSASASSYVNGAITPSFSTNPQITTDKGRGVYYIFTSPSNAVYLALPYTTQFTCYGCRNYSYGLDIEDAGDTTGLTQEELNQQITNQTTIINNQIDNLENSFSQNIQDLIGVQEEKTHEIIDSNKVCTEVEYSSRFGDNENTLGKYLSINNQEIDGANYNISPYYKISEGSTILLQSITYMNSTAFCFYNDNKEKLYCESWNQRATINITAPNNSYYIRTSIGEGVTITIKGKFCDNGNQVLNDSLNETNDSINNLDSTLKSDDIDDNNIASAFEDFNDFLDDNSTITQLITLPITLYTAILNNVNGSCSPFNLGSLFGEDLILPCINISQYLGSSLWTMIDIIISGFAVYGISKKMIKIFNNFSSLREGDVIDD